MSDPMPFRIPDNYERVYAHHNGSPPPTVEELEAYLAFLKSERAHVLAELTTRRNLARKKRPEKKEQPRDPS